MLVVMKENEPKIILMIPDKIAQLLKVARITTMDTIPIRNLLNP